MFSGHVDGDGVAVSNDGTTWHTVVNAADLDVGTTGQVFEVRLDDVGIPFTGDFQIKFQQFDNASWPTDGREFDNIEFTVCPDECCDDSDCTNPDLQRCDLSSGVCVECLDNTDCPGPDGDGDCSESCDPVTKTCTANDPFNSACDDGDACNTGETCQGGSCVGGSAVTCPDPDPADCVYPVCDAAGSEGNCDGSANEPHDTTCADNDVCTEDDVCTCQSGVCEWFCCCSTPEDGECCQLFGDLVGQFGTPDPGSDCDVNVFDILCVLNCFADASGNTCPQGDVVAFGGSCGSDGICDVWDILAVLNAFAFPNDPACPPPCAPEDACGAENRQAGSFAFSRSDDGSVNWAGWGEIMIELSTDRVRPGGLVGLTVRTVSILSLEWSRR